MGQRDFAKGLLGFCRDPLCSRRQVWLLIEADADRVCVEIAKST